jgi:hypothetical protein
MEKLETLLSPNRVQLMDLCTFAGGSHNAE